MHRRGASRLALITASVKVGSIALLAILAMCAPARLAGLAVPEALPGNGSLCSSEGGLCTGAGMSAGRPDCSQARCPVRFSTRCPPDSLLVEGTMPPEGCCPLPSRCECRPRERCPPAVCSPGAAPTRLAPADGTPGRCCELYACRADVGGSVEKPGPAGCLAGGKMRAEGSRWREDACTKCRCVGGSEQCVTQACGQHCEKGARVPGECCLRCPGPEESSSVTALPLTCDPLTCNLTEESCPYGFQLDEKGCRSCGCKTRHEFCKVLLAGCSLECPFGRRLGPHGCEMCRCRPKPKRCRPLVCSKACPHGYIRTRHGCETCRCVRCAALSCDKKCAHGYEVNGKGCPTCKCRALSSEGPVAPFCLSGDGRRYRDGDDWHDGCRSCTCLAGREMCTLLTCALPRCAAPTMPAGACCPTCPGQRMVADLAPQPKDPAVCVTPAGLLVSGGETFRLDGCTRCLCRAGRVLCDAEVCPPLPCQDAVKTPGSCCPMCPPATAAAAATPTSNASHGAVNNNNNSDESHGAVNNNNNSDESPPAMCRSASGAMFLAGEAWKRDACTSCACAAGEVTCHAPRCPPATCARPVLRKGQCCPYCPRNPSLSNVARIPGTKLDNEIEVRAPLGEQNERTQEAEQNHIPEARRKGAAAAAALGDGSVSAGGSRDGPAASSGGGGVAGGVAWGLAVSAVSSAALAVLLYLNRKNRWLNLPCSLAKEVQEQSVSLGACSGGGAKVQEGGAHAATEALADARPNKRSPNAVVASASIVLESTETMDQP
ncbi:unnamed protein product [Lampetra fluviatilis]